MAKSIWPADDQTETLLAAAREGDGDAVNRLLEKHRGPIRRLVEMRLDRKVQRPWRVGMVVQLASFSEEREPRRWKCCG